MTENSEKALRQFNNGLNCAQAVLSAFCEKYGLGEELALKMAGGLGSGFRSGEICGAVSGAVLVVGLKYGQQSADDRKAKQVCYEKTEEFIRAFRDRSGSVLCRELLGCDLSTAEGREKAQKEHLFDTICVEKVRSALELLEKLGY